MVSLLRGVNVGGRNLIAMDALRAVYGSLGLKHAASYVQSGNVAFAASGDAGAIAGRIETAIEVRFGFRPAVILRTCSELREVVARNPFASRPGIAPSRLLVLFLAGEPAPEARAKLLQLKPDPEELIAGPRELYIHYPNGMGRSKLTGALLERALGTPATGRNWNTVLKLLELAERVEGK